MATTSETTNVLQSLALNNWMTGTNELLTHYSVNGSAKSRDSIEYTLSHESLLAYYRVNKVIKFIKVDYQTSYDNHRDEFMAVVVLGIMEALNELQEAFQNARTIESMSMALDEQIESKIVYKLVRKHVSRGINQTFRTELNTLKALKVQETLKEMRKAIKETNNAELIKDFKANMSTTYSKVYSCTSIDDGTLDWMESAIGTEQQAITNVMITTLLTSPKLTYTNKETLKAIINHGWEADTSEKGRQNRHRLIKVARTVLL